MFDHMRKLYLFLLAMYSIHAQAQLWERADQRDEEIHLERVLPVGGGQWAVIGRKTFAGDHLISVHDSDGSIVWEDLGQYVVSHGPGDVIMMRIQAPVTNHAAVYLGNNIMLHHAFGNLSARVPYGKYYRDRTVRIVRHKELSGA